MNFDPNDAPAHWFPMRHAQREQARAIAINEMENRKMSLSHIERFVPGAERRKTADYQAKLMEAQANARTRWSLVPEAYLIAPRGKLENCAAVFETDLPGGLPELIALQDQDRMFVQTSDPDVIARNLPTGERSDYVVAGPKSLSTYRRGVVAPGFPIVAQDLASEWDPDGSTTFQSLVDKGRVVLSAPIEAAKKVIARAKGAA